MSNLYLENLDGELKAEPIRKGFGRGLAAGELDENVVAACADLTDSTQMSLLKMHSRTDLLKLVLLNKTWLLLAQAWRCDGKDPICL